MFCIINVPKSFFNSVSIYLYKYMVMCLVFGQHLVKQNDALVLCPSCRWGFWHVSCLKQIYMLQIRSKLDQSAVVWHSSLTQKNRNDLERVQKSAVRCILGDSYRGYEDALERLGLVTLEERREQMCLKFAKQCLKLEKMKQFFPRNQNSHAMEKRCSEFYQVVKSQTERFRKSAIPAMVKLLNVCQKEKRETFKKLDAMPVNHVCPSLYHCDNNKLQ